MGKSVKELVCINCPMGCRLSVELDGGEVAAVSGNTCKRGEAYARDECTAPKRVVTTLARVEGTGRPVPCRTAGAIPKELIFKCVDEVKRVVLKAPVRAGDVIVKDVCGSGVDVIATADSE